MEFEAIRNNPDFPPVVPETGAAENGNQNPTPLGPVPLAAHATAILVTFADATVPAPLVTAQVSPVGCTAMPTEYVCPEACETLKVNGPLTLTVNSSPSVEFSNCTEPPKLKPETAPPIVKEAGAIALQVTTMLVTLAEPSVPDPLVRAQVSPVDAVAVTA